MVLLGYAQHVGDHEHGEWLGVRTDELALPTSDELVDLLIGQAPHECLVVPQPFRSQETHDERPLTRVHGLVHGHHVLVHRELVPVRVDDVPDVVALERNGEGSKRPDDRVARGELVGIEVDLCRLLVARYRHDPVVGRGQDWALRAQMVEVGIGVLQQGGVGKEINRVVVRHQAAPVPLLSECLAFLVQLLSTRRRVGSTPVTAHRRGMTSSVTVRRCRQAISGGKPPTRGWRGRGVPALIIEKASSTVTMR